MRKFKRYNSILDKYYNYLPARSVQKMNKTMNKPGDIYFLLKYLITVKKPIFEKKILLKILVTSFATR